MRKYRQIYSLLGVDLRAINLIYNIAPDQNTFGGLG